MPSLLSFKSTVAFSFIAFAAAICFAPGALADEGGMSYDLSTLAQPVMQQAPAVTPAYMAGTGQQVAPQSQMLNYVPNPSNRTANQRLATLATATRTVLSQRSQTLPVCNLDSFVYQSGMSDLIYGDEGVDGPPPYFSMDESHTIGSGISSGGLTTNHQSNMPSAWCDYN